MNTFVFMNTFVLCISIQITSSLIQTILAAIAAEAMVVIEIIAVILYFPSFQVICKHEFAHVHSNILNLHQKIIIRTLPMNYSI